MKTEHFQGTATMAPGEAAPVGSPLGEPLHIQVGDALMFSANSTGIWDVQKTVRKTYVLIFQLPLP